MTQTFYCRNDRRLGGPCSRFGVPTARDDAIEARGIGVRCPACRHKLSNLAPAEVDA